MLNRNLVNKTISNLDHVEIFRLYKAMEWSMSPTIIKILEEKVSEEIIDLRSCNCGEKIVYHFYRCKGCSKYICGRCKSECEECGYIFCRKCKRRCVRCDEITCKKCYHECFY